MYTMFKGVGIYPSLENVASLRHCRRGVSGISLLGFLSGLLWLGAALRWLDIAEATQGPTTGSIIWFTGQFAHCCRDGHCGVPRFSQIAELLTG
ncbi:hypothetical protein JMJ56_30245 [Belnapia sp. T18]|uniref:Uncharacterized protein n=1 Tax=Belnapia arida TaxID=2804533 RepID=A0ABS1UCM0_9PROT|nr:hypothetical protein [Belnapia arida]MBL6082260.1 hypothetical protein [Belnapia arida]